MHIGMHRWNPVLYNGNVIIVYIFYDIELGTVKHHCMYLHLLLLVAELPPLDVISLIDLDSALGVAGRGATVAFTAGTLDLVD